MTELERLRKLVMSWLEEEGRKPHPAALRLLESFEHEVRRDERRAALAEALPSEGATRGEP